MTLVLPGLCSALLSACREQSTIGIIGGADGPTSVFITSTSGHGWLWLLLLLLFIMLILLALRSARRKRR